MLFAIFEILIDPLLLVPNTTAIAAHSTVTGSLRRKQALYIVFASMYKVNLRCLTHGRLPSLLSVTPVNELSPLNCRLIKCHIIMNCSVRKVNTERRMSRTVPQLTPKFVHNNLLFSSRLNPVLFWYRRGLKFVQ